MAKLPAIVSAQDAATQLGLSREYVCRLCRDGVFPGAVRLGKSWVIPASDLKNYKPVEGMGRPKKEDRGR